MDKDYKNFCEREEAIMAQEEKHARRHMKTLVNSQKEKMKNGSYPEQARLIVSMHCSN